jgi:nicotinate phosphoribosyltransferase
MHNHSTTLLTDRYQLTMLAAHAESGLASRRAVFELFVRRLPSCRRFMVMCGLGRAVEALKHIGLTSEELDYLDRDPVLGPVLKKPKVRELFSSLRFRGKVWAIPEGRICFPHEPLIRVEGTLAEAQIVETLLLSIINHDTRVASKCARIVEAAQGRPCFEFGTRRTHEACAVDAARSAYIGGFVGTSNELAGMKYGLPVSGTMAHAYILAHAADGGEEGELEAFRSFCSLYEEPSICLIDTFDSMLGVDRAIEMEQSFADRTALAGIRIDSGDLADLTIKSREKLDKAGLTEAKIVLSDDLDEYKIDKLINAEAPVSAFGVGTMAVSTPDAPSLGAVYKLVAMEDKHGKMVAVQKKAGQKGSSAAPKQVFRKPGTLHDVVGYVGETLPGTPLLECVFEHGRMLGDHRTSSARTRLEEDRKLASQKLRQIALRTENEGYPSQSSKELQRIQELVGKEGRMVLP